MSPAQTVGGRGLFSAGFSYGGMMSFAIACEMGDVFRALAPMSGALYSGCGNGTNPIALFGTHGTATPSPCVTHQGCDEGYPVTWCEFDGGHSPQRWSSQPVWDFFSSF